MDKDCVMEENEHEKKERRCEVICKTPTGPVWPTAPHWLSACQTNCFCWQRAVKTAWSRTWKWRNSYFLLPLGPVQLTLDSSMGITGWSRGVTGPFWSLPWTLCSYSSPPVPTFYRDNFTATYQLLNYYVCRMLQSLLPEYKIALSCQFLCASTSEAPGPSSWRGMKEELRFPTELLLHSRSWCSRGQGGVGSNSKLERARKRIWNVWRE